MFRVGQKVCCVDDSISRADGVRELSEGSVYIVRWAGHAMFGAQEYAGVCLFEVKRDEPDLAFRNNADQPFDADRFRPIADRKTDISIFTEMLTPADSKELIP